VAQNLQAVERALPESCEDRKFKGTLAELDLPLL